VEAFQRDSERPFEVLSGLPADVVRDSGTQLALWPIPPQHLEGTEEDYSGQQN
jgi:hypothetical protein